MLVRRQFPLSAMVMLLFVTMFGGVTRASAADATFTARVGNYTAGFIEPERIRHHRYELQLRQTAELTPRFKTAIEARLRFDAALYPDERAPQRDLSDAVRDDEMSEADIRQAYVDWLGDLASLRIGLQQIDWVESLSTRSSDVLTPVDLRFGGFGGSGDNIVPMAAASINHRFVAGSLEWLLVPAPKPHRLARGANGYGYYESLSRIGDPRLEREIKSGSIPESGKSMEGGVRWLGNAGDFDMTLLAYRGHQRSPTLVLSRPDPVDPRRITIEETFPRCNTFGAFSSWSGDSAVLRFIGLFEPEREARVFSRLSPEPRRIMESRLRGGFGWDYVYSKDLKIYSEHYLTRTRAYYADEDSRNAPAIDDPIDDTWSTSLRLTNETFDDVFATLDGVLTGPERSWTISPQLTITMLSDYKLSFGANFIRSISETSAFEPLRDASHVWLALDAWFDGKRFGAEESNTAAVR